MLFQLGYSQYSINQNNLEYNLLIYLLVNPTVSSDSVESIINRIIMVNTLGLVRSAVVGKVVGLFWGT
jgi:hypothetical protein